MYFDFHRIVIQMKRRIARRFRGEGKSLAEITLPKSSLQRSIGQSIQNALKIALALRKQRNQNRYILQRTMAER